MSFKKRRISLCLSITMLVSTLLPMSSMPFYAATTGATSAGVSSEGSVLKVSFEDDDLKGWTGNGDMSGYTFEVTTQQACTINMAESQKSLKVANRKNLWEGPKYPLEGYNKGDTVTVSAWVYNPDTSTHNFGFSANMPESATNQYPWVGENISIPSQSWAKIEGTITFDSKPNMIYIDTRGEYKGDFYVDDIEMSFTKGEVQPPEELGDEIVSNTFEADDTTKAQWIPNGAENVVVAVSPEKAYEGENALKISGRTKKYDGPKIILKDKAEKGKMYHYSAWLYQETGKEKVAFLTANYQNPSENYVTISQVTLPSGQWTQLTGEYTFPMDAQGNYNVYIESSSKEESVYESNKTLDITGYDSFYMDQVSIKGAGALPELNLDETPALKDYFDFPIGVAVKDTSYLQDDRNAKLIAHHFDSITAENEMKPSYIQPTENEFFFTNTDKYINFVKQNEGMRLRGHTLLWHVQNPDWMFKGLPENPTEKREALLARMKSHITACMLHSGDNVDVWDVVNEAVGDNQPYGMRQSDYYQIVGPDFVEQAFRMADEVRKEHNLDVKLYYNDYNNQESAGKRQGILDFVTNLKKSGVPIDGVGYQGHVGNDFGNIIDMEKSLRGFLDLGLEVEITELDITVYPSHQSADAPITEEQLIKQAYRYKQVADLLNKLNREYPRKITGLTLWGLKDDDSWLNYFEGNNRTDAPLLFDKNQQPKYAYWALVGRMDKVPSIVQDVKSYKNTVSIDGIKEDKWDTVQGVNIKDEEGLVIGNLKSLWDDNSLYLWIEVEDQNINEEDALELFVDPNNSRNAFTPNEDLKYVVKRVEGLSQEGLTSFTKNQNNGYITEVAIPMTKSGNALGLDVRINLGDRKVSFNDKQNLQDTSTKSYAKVSLENPKYMEAAEGVPTIDGVIDELWSKVDQVKTDIVSKNGTAVGAFKTLWSGNKLYILAQVKDPVLSAQPNVDAYKQDSVEVFIDENNHKTTYYEDDDAQYRVNYLNKQSFSGVNAKSENMVSQTKVTEDGYIAEIQITFNSIAEVKKDQVIGIEFQINDDSTQTGERSGTANWNDNTGNAWQNTSTFGFLKLLAPEPVPEPTPEPTPTPMPTPTPTPMPTPTPTPIPTPIPTPTPTPIPTSGSGSGSTSAPIPVPQEKPAVIFNDMMAHEWAKEAVTKLANKGILVGDAQGNFLPNKQASRGEIVSILVRFFGLKPVESTTTFSDVDKTKYYYSDVAILESLNLIKGYSGKFRPEESITRQDMALLLVNVMKMKAEQSGVKLGSTDIEFLSQFKDAVTISPYAKEALGRLVADGTLVGFNHYLNPKRPITRAEVAVLLNRALK